MSVHAGTWCTKISEPEASVEAWAKRQGMAYAGNIGGLASKLQRGLAAHIYLIPLRGNL